MSLQLYTEELFSGMVKEDIVYFMLSNYAKINKKEVREDLALTSRSIASNFSDANWNSLEQYAKDKSLGEYIEISGKRRWAVNNLYINIKKVDKNLKPTKLDIDDSGQMSLPFDLPYQGVSIEHPLLIGYIPDNRRCFIQEIHVIKYKADGSVDWNIPLYKHCQTVEVESTQNRKDLKSIVKVKQPNGNVVNLFDDNN